MALAPALFHRTAPGFECAYTDLEAGRKQAVQLTAAGLTADLHAAWRYLCTHTSRIAAAGFCMGGAISVVATTILPIKAAVSYYGAPRYVEALAGGRWGDRVHGPVLFYWGGRDAHIDAAARSVVATEMDRAGKPYVNVLFSDADHGFNCDARSSFHPASSAQAWALTQAFLDAHV